VNEGPLHPCAPLSCGPTIRIAVVIFKASTLGGKPQIETRSRGVEARQSPDPEYLFGNCHDCCPSDNPLTSRCFMLLLVSPPGFPFASPTWRILSRSVNKEPVNLDVWENHSITAPVDWCVVRVSMCNGDCGRFLAGLHVNTVVCVLDPQSSQLTVHLHGFIAAAIPLHWLGR